MMILQSNTPLEGINGNRGINKIYGKTNTNLRL